MQKNNNFLITIASIALIADLIIIAQAILSGGFASFWTFSWIMTIIFIVLLFGIGIYLFYIGSENEIFDTILTIFGGAYILLCIALYIQFGYAQLYEQNTVAQFFGFLLILFVLSYIGLSSIFVQENKTVLYASYAYVVAVIVYILMLVVKYVFKSADFSFLTFSGEVILILIGAWLFLSPYKIATGKSTRSNFIMKFYLIDNREEARENI